MSFECDVKWLFVSRMKKKNHGNARPDFSHIISECFCNRNPSRLLRLYLRLKIDQTEP